MRRFREACCLLFGHRWLLYQSGELTLEQCRRCNVSRPLRWRDVLVTLAKRG